MNTWITLLLKAVIHPMMISASIATQLTIPAKRLMRLQEERLQRGEREGEVDEVGRGR